MNVNRTGIILGLIIGSVCIILELAGIFSFLELKTLDMRFALRGPQDPGAEVVIVAIDAESIGWLESWPWPRSYHAKLTDNLKAVGAKVIAFDVLFDSESSLDPAHDAKMASAIKKAGNVILCSSFAEKNDPKVGTIKTHQLPIKILKDAAAGTAFINPPTDIDGFIRRYWLFREFDNELYPSMAVKAIAQYTAIPVQKARLLPNSVVEIGPYRIPYNQDGTILLNYAGRGGTFRTVPYDQVLDGSLMKREPKLFQDKIVLIGATVPELHDLFSTPAGLAYPGVEIHATAISTILQNKYLMKASPLINAAIIMALALLIGLLAQNISVFRGIFTVLCTILLYSAAAVYAFDQLRLWLIVIAPVFAVASVYVVIMVGRYISEEREKKKIRAMFSKYVSPAVVEELIKDPSKLTLGGQKKELTVFFSDLRGFTTYSENHSPEEVVSILNEYLDVMTAVIR